MVKTIKFNKKKYLKKNKTMRKKKHIRHTIHKRKSNKLHKNLHNKLHKNLHNKIIYGGSTINNMMNWQHHTRKLQNALNNVQQTPPIKLAIHSVNNAKKSADDVVGHLSTAAKHVGSHLTNTKNNFLTSLQ
tara:strand:- start:1200 stop:1592 length:393 start_codon:yes stop_codon:yes gene_type:complete